MHNPQFRRPGATGIDTFTRYALPQNPNAIDSSVKIPPDSPASDMSHGRRSRRKNKSIRTAPARPPPRPSTRDKPSTRPHYHLLQFPYPSIPSHSIHFLSIKNAFSMIIFISNRSGHSSRTIHFLIDDQRQSHCCNMRIPTSDRPLNIRRSRIFRAFRVIDPCRGDHLQAHRTVPTIHV